MELELRHLRTVRAIAETGSLNKAAALLGLAQPALSTQLRRLEGSLGGSLFVRDRTGARPTPLGEVILERARVVLPAVQGLQQEVARLADGGSAPTRLRIGGTHGPLVGELVRRVADTLPGMPVTVHTSWSLSELARMVATGRLDYILGGVCGDAVPPAAGELAWRTLGTDPVFAMLSEDHQLATAERLPLRSLATERWAIVPGDGCFADCFAAACFRAGFAPVALLESDVSSCTHLVQVGRAVALCRASIPPGPGTVTRPLAGAPLSWRHVLGWHPEGPSASIAQAVAGWAGAGYADAVRRSGSYTAWLADRAGFGPATARHTPRRKPSSGAS